MKKPVKWLFLGASSLLEALDPEPFWSNGNLNRTYPINAQGAAPDFLESHKGFEVRQPGPTALP